MNIGDRIKKARINLGMTQTEFAKRIGSMQNTIARYETNNRNPSASVIALICREFNVNEEWLRTGAGEMFKTAPSSALDALAEEYKLSAESRVMIEKFVNLKPEVQDAIFNYVREVAAAFCPTEDARHEETDADRIDREVADYRRQLELEARQAEELSASKDGETEKRA